MPFAGFPRQTFEFLKGLEANNSKAWFEAHRGDFENYHLAPSRAFIEAIGPGLRKISKTVNAEPKVNGSIFRINRDSRFSKDKRPYKTTLDLWFWEGETRSWEVPGFFLRLMPDRVIAGAGMHQFSPAQLARYRKAVVDGKAGAQLGKVIAGLGDMKLGEATRQKVPRGYDEAHPLSALLLHDGLHAIHEGPPPKSVHRPEFVEFCLDKFRAAAPVSRWIAAHVLD
jgi:uncharacterized protein (TIGR02453 family)